MSRRGTLYLLSGLLAVVPLVPIVVALSLGSSPSSSAQAASRFRPLPSQSRSARAPGGAEVAQLIRPTAMRLRPGGRVLAGVGLHTEFGSPTAMLVVAQQDGWLGVLSPLAGNGRVGWIPRSAASLSRVAWALRISLGARRLTVLEDGRVMRQVTVAVGRPDAPTPAGRFAITDRLQPGDPSGPYGCCILATSARSPHAIQDWSGGDRIAVHSTPDTGSVGLPVSHGCLRVTFGDGRWLLAHIPLGTPVTITA